MIPLRSTSILDLSLLAGLYGFVLYPRYKKLEKRQYWLHTLFFAYICLVLLVTVMPILTSLPHLFNHGEIVFHLEPFEDLRLGYLDAEKQIILNILLMVPVGYLLPKITRLKGWSVLLAGCMCIEWIQPYLNSMRSCDITDVITNTSGVILGYVLHLILMKIISK